VGENSNSNLLGQNRATPGPNRAAPAQATPGPNQAAPAALGRPAPAALGRPGPSWARGPFL